MIQPAIPQDEESRLAALRSLNVLDTPREERYDRMVRKLAELMDVPIAYLALVDVNRQWLKSEVGGMACQLDRGVSFCGHTILGDRPLVIPDAMRDPRFAGNPMVIGEPHIRFYAGVPLTGSGGHNVGTLCIADHEPRELGPDDLEVLGAFAARVQAKLSSKPKVFISYSHKDEEWKDRLLSHLSVLQEQELLHLWDDRRIGAGDEWKIEIQEAMETSNVAILLITANFLTSDFILDVEVPRLLSRRDQEGLQIVPVVVKPCIWDRVGWLQRMNLYPRDGRPLSAGSDYDVDSLLVGLASIVLDKSRQPAKAPPEDGRIRLAEPAPETPPAPAVNGAFHVNGASLLNGASPLNGASAGVRLAVARKGEAGEAPERFTFRRSQILIGRNACCALPLADDQRVVSGRHAEILVEGDGNYLTDLGSKNFTYLNGERLEPRQRYRLTPGDVIGIHEYEIVFQLLDLPAEADPDPTLFEPGYLNPFQADACHLAQVLGRLAERYDGEAPNRRDAALQEALAEALATGNGHRAHRVIGRQLGQRCQAG